jgi:tetratricopeptide (TPR) repeat protein
MRTFAKKAIELAPRYVESYALLARVDLNSGENLEEAEGTLKKALSIAPGRDDLQLLLAQAYLRADRRDDARSVLEMIERSASSIDIRRRATALLDQTEKTATFTEITPAIEKALAEQAKEPTPPRPQPAPSVPTARRAEETVLESLTPVGPGIEGEKITGLLVNLECENGLTLTVRTDRTSMQLRSTDPQKIQFLSYTTDVTDNIRCGARNPGTPVTVTYRAVPGAPAEPLVIEFLEKK